VTVAPPVPVGVGFFSSGAQEAESTKKISDIYRVDSSISEWLKGENPLPGQAKVPSAARSETSGISVSFDERLKAILEAAEAFYPTGIATNISPSKMLGQTEIPEGRWAVLAERLSGLSLADERAKGTVERLHRWIVSHPTATFIDPSVIVRECKVSPGDISRALVKLVEMKVLKVRYKAASPFSHSLTDKDFGSPTELDNELYDPVGNRIFRKEDAEIVPVFMGT
jgi:hypothetical protein